MSRIISIEGNIGAGKSTLLKLLYLEIRKRNIIFLQEPVGEWNEIKDKNGETMIQKFYKDQARYSFSFQMMAQISRMALLRRTIAANPNSDIIIERSVETDRQVFAKMLYDDGKIEDVEYQIYLKWHNEFVEELKSIKIIYLDVPPEICSERVATRDRKGETIPLAYLERCGAYHDRWLSEKENILKIEDFNAEGLSEEMKEKIADFVIL